MNASYALSNWQLLERSIVVIVVILAAIFVLEWIDKRCPFRTNVVIIVGLMLLVMVCAALSS